MRLVINREKARNLSGIYNSVKSRYFLFCVSVAERHFGKYTPTAIFYVIQIMNRPNSEQNKQELSEPEKPYRYLAV